MIKNNGFKIKILRIILIFFVSTVIFISCSEDDDTSLTKENLYGKWIGQTTKSTFDFNTQEFIKIHNIFDFQKSGNYEVSTPELNLKIGFDSHPNINANWDINSNDYYIRMFWEPEPGFVMPGWEYQWRVIHFHPDSMFVNVYDQEGNFIRERSFRKIK